jgi:hypothetical protein
LACAAVRGVPPNKRGCDRTASRHPRGVLSGFFVVHQALLEKVGVAVSKARSWTSTNTQYCPWERNTKALSDFWGCTAFGFTSSSSLYAREGALFNKLTPTQKASEIDDTSLGSGRFCIVCSASCLIAPHQCTSTSRS